MRLWVRLCLQGMTVKRDVPNTEIQKNPAEGLAPLLCVFLEGGLYEAMLVLERMKA